MDPNANLREQREIAARLITPPRSLKADTQQRDRDAIRLAELVQALDEWLLRGGFLPDFWEQASGRRRGQFEQNQ